VFDFFFDTGSYFVAQAGLELTILLPLPPECWNYRLTSPEISFLMKPLFPHPQREKISHLLGFNEKLAHISCKRCSIRAHNIIVHGSFFF
jgi:hypothetical protein